MTAKANKITKPILPKMGEITWIFGVLCVALGVAICKKANLGVSMIAAPPFIIYEALADKAAWLTVGTVEYLFQGILLILLCIGIQRFNWRYLLAFAVAILYGYALDMWLLIIGTEPFNALWLRWVMLIVGDTVTAFGVACYFRTYLPLQVYELCVAELADRYKVKVNKMKLFYDTGSLTLSLILALSLFGDVATFNWKNIYSEAYHCVGLGTLITTIINTPIITAWGKLFDRFMGYEPLFPKLKKFLAVKHK